MPQGGAPSSGPQVAQVRALLANKNYFARGCHLHTGRATLRTRITAVGSRGRDGACALRRRTARHRPWCSTPTSASCASTTRRTASERSAGRRRPMRRCACCALCATRRSAATAAAPWWARRPMWKAKQRGLAWRLIIAPWPGQDGARVALLHLVSYRSFHRSLGRIADETLDNAAAAAARCLLRTKLQLRHDPHSSGLPHTSATPCPMCLGLQPRAHCSPDRTAAARLSCRAAAGSHDGGRRGDVPRREGALQVVGRGGRGAGLPQPHVDARQGPAPRLLRRAPQPAARRRPVCRARRCGGRAAQLLPGGRAARLGGWRSEAQRLHDVLRRARPAGGVRRGDRPTAASA